MIALSSIGPGWYANHQQPRLGLEEKDPALNLRIAVS